LPEEMLLSVSSLRHHEAVNDKAPAQPDAIGKDEPGQDALDSSARLGDDRDRTAEARDERAEAHDDASNARDERAEARDERAEAREQASDVINKGAAADRAGALRDRRGGASDRTQAADDREAAAADRMLSAQERAASSIDELTGAYRRDAGTLALEREVSRAQRTEKSLVVAFVDVDGLKVTNDSLGHAAGDRRLRVVVATIRKHLRSYDLIVRFGGDEFVCALGELALSKAAKRFEAARADLEAADLGSITVGLAELQPGDSLEDVIARADHDLYTTRANGGSH
jgi:diguanylate cyclase (GGDEF)-like protein